LPVIMVFRDHEDIMMAWVGLDEWLWVN